MNKLIECLNPETAALVLKDINAVAEITYLSPELIEARDKILAWYKDHKDWYKEVFEEVMK